MCVRVCVCVCVCVCMREREEGGGGGESFDNCQPHDIPMTGNKKLQQ